MEIDIKTAEEFEKEVLQSEIPVLVDFYADWCGPCKMMMPLIENFAKENDGKIKVAKVNIDENSEVTINYGVMSVPTFMAFRGGKKTGESVGYQPIEEINEMFK